MLPPEGQNFMDSITAGQLQSLSQESAGTSKKETISTLGFSHRDNLEKLVCI